MWHNYPEIVRWPDVIMSTGSEPCFSTISTCCHVVIVICYISFSTENNLQYLTEDSSTTEHAYHIKLQSWKVNSKTESCWMKPYKSTKSFVHWNRYLIAFQDHTKWYSLFHRYFIHWCWVYLSCNFGRMLSVGTIYIEDRFCPRKIGGVRGGGWVSPSEWQHMAVILAGYRKALVCIGWTIFHLVSTNGHRSHSSPPVGAPFWQQFSVQRNIYWSESPDHCKLANEWVWTTSWTQKRIDGRIPGPSFQC